jgi:dihydrofolate reductase
MRTLTYYIAGSLDGFIAQQDDSFADFAMDEAYIRALAAAFPETFPAHFRGLLGIAEAENQHFDTVLMGRRTYEVGLKVGLANPYPHLVQYVVSRRMEESPHPAITLVREEVATVVQQLKQEAGKGIWLCGGGQLATTLLNAGLIDRLMVKLNPFLMGDGIAMFAQGAVKHSLNLVESQRYENGVMMLTYNLGHFARSM